METFELFAVVCTFSETAEVVVVAVADGVIVGVCRLGFDLNVVEMVVADDVTGKPGANVDFVKV